MKKIGILNSQISKVISELGHTDRIVICDAGLPIPDHVERIDLALTPGTPSFLLTLEAVLQEMQVEKAYWADEIKAKNNELWQRSQALLPDVAQICLSHTELKKLTHGAKAIIRTGECSPYANVILESGVIF
ncbi:D-ribose pyranase [Brevibacillus humidisoli]|uniref:D-ribose pyranase n=1 Tax=Brevibacillus humidisoli TaxID=2895522 RepID=UPI001E32EC86|nr:D-ribose pyranase [Brevibacillus humidisoli]UFJ41806.1 D-ribose pyranase [Brevibacillus humidisoli]